MDKLLFIAMSGAKETMTAQAINANNLANASTTGFRADFQSSMSQPVYGDVHPSRVYVENDDPGVDFTQGSIISTGRELDVAINGQGWLTVKDENGNDAYTRAGDLRMNSQGQLSTGAGHMVVGNGGPIAVPPNAKLEIGSDGTISIQPLGQGVNTLAVIDRLKLVNPDTSQMEKGLDGLMRMKDGSSAVADGSVGLVSASLESSNVNTVGAKVRMIELARQYETHIKLMSTAESNDEASAKLLQVS